MSTCGVFKGILFSRRACGEPAAIHCGRCKILVCKTHIKPQAKGPFLCPSCDAYEHDDGWNYSSRDNRWRHSSGSSSRDERIPAAAAGAAGGAAIGAATGAGAAAGTDDLTDEDKEGFSTVAGAHEPAGSDGSDDSGGSEESDFDAS